MSACSLLEELARINSLGFSDCVPIAVTRLSRVSVCVCACMVCVCTRGVCVHAWCVCVYVHVCYRPLRDDIEMECSCDHTQIVTASHSDLQDYTYYFVPAPWLTVKLMRLLQCFSIPGQCSLTVFTPYVFCTHRAAFPRDGRY